MAAPSLIRSIREHATVPVIIDGDGNCHVYVDDAADLDVAFDIVLNAKTHRPSVCNAAESLVVHEAIADAFLPRVADALIAEGVELVGDEASRRRVPAMGAATEEDFASEFLALRLSVATVPTLDAGIDHVNRYGSGHTEAIVTRSLDSARRFTHEVDAAAVVVNASTRFTDGEQFGFGAEIGISTQKLHARGPDGAARADDLQVPDMGRWTGEELSGGEIQLGRRRGHAPPDRRTTSPTPASQGSCTSPTGSRSRCWSRDRPASARPSSRRRWRRSPARG